MPSHLPYTARTRTGDVFEISFPLHAETGSPMRVSQLLTAILETLDREIALLGDTSNGDMLQALSMATAIRAAMIHAPLPVTQRLATELQATALRAMDTAARQSPPAGHA
ncbi:hypothetical protein [Ferrovibrio sp.]|uniref:hypothetical protein n=1 Tax=Ferrovibrio sp. TaxID=1917215 RepID=UPI002605C609|nr:hypothetical protein [Ferrovibrio sp.]